MKLDINDNLASKVVIAVPVEDFLSNWKNSLVAGPDSGFFDSVDSTRGSRKGMTNSAGNKGYFGVASKYLVDDPAYTSLHLTGADSKKRAFKVVNIEAQGLSVGRRDDIC
ncbi:hypothetical protein A1F94_012712 [Pyrenophora tritici-repentis]|nr:hypothetical protein A1F94_012712 [Pyrenophora tritici-repentis]